MPPDTGAAFVLIQHLDPTRESLTGELVGTYTQMPVVQVEDGMAVEENRVYVIPPNAYLSIRDRTLRLSPPTAARGSRMAIDFFLQSLAEDQKDRAVGIILAGTGTDGTLGLKAIKAAGGMTIVQAPETVQHDGMPRSAIASGSADFTVPAEEMATVLRASALRGPIDTTLLLGGLEEPLTTVLRMLGARAKLDFTAYKKGTLQRRIQHRMSLTRCEKLPQYVELLRQTPTELDALFKDLLIHITSFFREPAAWKVLRERVVRPLLAAKPPDEPLRVWVPACATGEEAYSVAMLLLEELDATQSSGRIQVFASDVDVEALNNARTGVYPERIAADVSSERLLRFFVKLEHGYRVSKELRDLVAFAQQNLVSDPPFSRLDLICCRNLFIYLEAAVQLRIIPLLHFALREGGYLFLGSAEGIGAHTELFEPVSSKRRIYRRIGPARPARIEFPLVPIPSPVSRGAHALPTANPSRLATLAPQVLLDRYAPACVIITRAGEILYFHGRTHDYFEQPTGVPTHDILAQARGGLRIKLRGAIHEAVRSNQRVALSGIQLRLGGTVRSVSVTVEPLDASHVVVDGLWLVSFENESTPGGSGPSVEPDRVQDATVVHQLEHELRSTREDLQQTIEDLRAANEELMSVNEEFQSSNEELETSKEELQSLNEELSTANSRLEANIQRLAATNDDVDNLLTSTNIATLFLDRQLRIRRFTPAATKLFSLIATDLGRPIEDIAQKFTDPELLPTARVVLDQPATPKKEIQAHDGRWYVRQILPYRTLDQRTEGVVITFSDVAAEAIQEARLYAESIVNTVREPLLVLDADLRVRSANQSFYLTFRLTPENTVGQLLYEIGNRQFDIASLRTLLTEVLPDEHVFNDFEMQHDLGDLGHRSILLNARTLKRGAGRPGLILLAIEDVTERRAVQAALHESQAHKSMEEQLRQRQAELAHALRISTVGELASGLAHEINQPLSAIANGVEACAAYVRTGDAGPEKILALLEEASAEALRAASIVEHLRHFIEKGRPQLERFDLSDIVRNVARLMARDLDEAHITMRLDIEPGPTVVNADRIQIEQVLVNLVQNAIDALGEVAADQRTLDLTVWAAKGRAEVAVRDTGAGVSGDASTRMFEPFFTTKALGLGMGLAISRSIVEANLGRIWVKRRVDGKQGTAARFTLPLARPAHAKEISP